MRKLRNIGKMCYPNDNNRDLYESCLNYHVLCALKCLIKNNDLDCVLINHLIVGYHHKPMRTGSIEILVKDKTNVKFKYFPNNKYYKYDVPIEIYDINDYGLTEQDYDEIKKDSIISNGFNIISPTFLTILYIKNGGFSLDNNVDISKLIDNSKLDFKILEKFINIYDIELLNNFIKKNNKDFMMKHLKSYKKYNTCRIYESKYGYAEVDAAFDDWVDNTEDVNQVLIGGIAVINYTEKFDKDRTTEDADFIFLKEEDIPDSVYKFKRIRPHSFQHIKTHVEIKVLTSKTINLPQEIVDIIFKTSYKKDSYRIASPSALVALKLDRFSDRDIKDINSLVDNYDINLDEFMPYLSDRAKENYNSIIKK